MANVRFISPNSADVATLTVSPAAVSTLPVTNLQDQTRSKIWRSTSTADQTISGEFATATTVMAFVFYRHNLTNLATIRFQLYAGAAGTGTLLYDSTAVAIGTFLAERFYVAWFVGGAARSFKVIIHDPTNPDGYVQATRLVVGSYFEPVINMSRGLQLSWPEASKQQRTDGGTLRTDGFEPNRRWVIKLELLTEEERTTLLQIARDVGLRQDFFVSCFPTVGGATERDYAGLVKFTQIPVLTYMTADLDIAHFDTDLVMEES